MNITDIKINKDKNQAWIKTDRGTFQTTDKEIIEELQKPVPKGQQWGFYLELVEADSEGS